MEVQRHDDPARLLTLALIVGSASAVQASDDKIATRLSGFNEVHFIAAPTPALRGAVSTPARGSFEARFDDRDDIIHYKLTYEGLTGDVTQAAAIRAGRTYANVHSATFGPGEIRGQIHEDRSHRH